MYFSCFARNPFRSYGGPIVQQRAGATSDPGDRLAGKLLAAFSDPKYMRRQRWRSSPEAGTGYRSSYRTTKEDDTASAQRFALLTSSVPYFRTYLYVILVHQSSTVEAAISQMHERRPDRTIQDETTACSD